MGPGAVDVHATRGHAGDQEDAQIVRFFGRFDCLIEPALVQHLARLDDPEDRAERVLAAMGEVPFYLTLATFRDVEARVAAAPGRPDAPSTTKSSTTTPATARGGSATGEHDGATAPHVGPEGHVHANAPSATDAATAAATSTASTTPAHASASTAPARSTAERQNEAPGATPAHELDPATAENEAHRKAALARMIELVYDQKARDMSEGADGGADDDADEHNDGDGPAPEAERQYAPWEVDWSKPIQIKTAGTWRPSAADHDGDLEILQDITGQSTCEGTTDDFHKFFRSRYDQLERILRKRRELANAQPIDRTLDSSARDVAMIGMVAECRTTANGHRLIELEDETGKAPCLVANNDRTDPQLIMSAGVIVPDEVIGIVGRKAQNGDLIIVDQIVRPDIPYNTERRKAEEPLAAAFLSDIHVGSNLFLEKNFVSMMRWLNGDTGTERERRMAGRIKYLVLPGDMVDGVGIYPGQEHGLRFTDIYDQYAEFGRLLEHIPDHIEVIVQPGNHDAARPNEPQPAVDVEVREKFDGVNAHFVGNPCLFSLNGVRVLSYHGVSLMDFATTVTGLEHHDPVPIMEEILKCRHLAPIYGLATPLAPEHRDWMVIDQVPELFATGHVHTFNVRNYRGVQMVNCSTWQAQTDYQKMLNFKPDPCRMPIYDLQTLKMTSMDFGMGMDFSYAGGK